jgi:hypothetical protein
VVLGLSLLVTAGCSRPPPPAVTVTGKITRNGNAIALSRGEFFRVILIQEVPPGTQPSLRRTKAELDGSFTLENVPVGKYRVGIEQVHQATNQDALQGAFVGQNSFSFEINGQKPVEIDLARPTG